MGLWPFDFWQSNKVSQDSVNGLRLTPAATLYTTKPPKKLLDLREFSLLLNLSSGSSASHGYARILSYSLDDKQVNLMVGQWEDNLIFRLKTGVTKRIIHFETDHVLKKGEKSWLAIVFDGNGLSLYQEGKIRNRMRTGPLDFSRWNGSFPLVIGSEANGKFRWQGSIYSITLFDQAFSPEEVKIVPTHIKEYLTSNRESKKPLIHYSFDDSQNEPIIDRGKGEPAHLTIPRYFDPYKRVALEKPSTRLGDYRRNLKDIVMNIVGFVPLGFLLSLYLLPKGLSSRSSLLLSVVIGFCLSLMVEVLQAFLPTRSSSMTDMIANTLGTAIGSFAYMIKKEYSLPLHLSLP